MPPNVYEQELGQGSCPKIVFRRVATGDDHLDPADAEIQWNILQALRMREKYMQRVCLAAPHSLFCRSSL